MCAAALLRWSRSPLADLALAVAMFGLGVLLHLTASGQRILLSGPEPPLWLRLAVLGVACAAQTQRRRMPVFALLVVFGAFLADGLHGFSVPTLLVLIDLLFAATLYSSRRKSRAVVGATAVVVLGMTASALVYIPDWRGAVQVVLSVLSVALVPVWWAMQVRHHREVASAERERAEQQARIAEMDRRAAIAEERGRMAKDLHDVVSGHLSAIAIQSEAVLQREREPETVRRVLHAVRENSVSALTEMRAMIELLRSDDDARSERRTSAAGLRDLGRLVDSARAGGLIVELTAPEPKDGDREDGSPAAVDIAAYRIVQEALTNAVKHASGAHTAVVLSHQGEQLVVQVTNDMPIAPTGRGSGTGLLSMAERAHAVGGTLDAGRCGDGWRVHAVLPTGGARP